MAHQTRSSHTSTSTAVLINLFFSLVSLHDSHGSICCIPWWLNRTNTDANLDGQPKEHQHQQAAGSKQQHSPQDATLVPLGSAHTNTANSTDSLLGDSRSVAPPNGQNVVSPSVMARFLEDELKSSDALLLGTPIKHCDTCVCTRNVPGGGDGGAGSNEGSLLLADLLGSEQKYYSVATQTLIKGETNNSLCLRCNSNLNSPSHNNSPYIMKLIKSSDSVISETKSSVSDYLTTPDKVSPTGGGNASGGNATSNGETNSLAETGTDPLATMLLPPTKKDDLMVNPILGHHRLATHDRSSANGPSPGDHPHAPLLLGKPTNPATPYASAKLPSHVGVKKPTPPPPPTPQSTTKTIPGCGLTQSPPERGGPPPAPPQTAATRNESKFSHDSPSYIIKDTDQMSGSHTTPKSTYAGQGTINQVGAKYGTASASGSVGSGLYHTVGSTNSLWSRTSSKDPEKDGAKMFEIFNRNLIKTIKAENPKMSGPRICALRIQNGSSNILLDNLIDDALEGVDSKPPTPVMYTRRAKFLDEELLLDDDPSIGLNGAIKTTNLPTAASSSGESGVLGKLVETPSKQGGVGDVTAATVGGSGTGVGDTAEGHGHLIDGSKAGRVDDAAGGDGGAGKQVCNMSTTTSPHSSDRLCTIGEEVSNLLINTKLGPTRLDPKPPRLDISVNKLDGLDVTSKKSCTQSSSISSEIDIQESAILRRQQLSRVAEWVQNNSKLGNSENLSHTESDHEPAASRAALLTDTLNNNPPATVKTSSARTSVLAHADQSKPLPTAMAGDIRMGRINSTQPLGSYIGGETFARCNIQTGPHNNNNNNNNNNNSPHHNPPNSTFAQLNGAVKVGGAKHGYNNALHSSMSSGGFQHRSATAGLMLDYNSNATGTTTAGTASSSTGVPFQCPPASSASGAIRKGSYSTSGPQLRDGAHTECLVESVGGPQPPPPSAGDAANAADDDDDDSNSIDLAQMEYNVKQFLLKQNEWSTVHTRRPSLISSSASSVKGRDEPLRPAPSTKGLFPGTAVAQTPHGTYPSMTPTGGGLGTVGGGNYHTRTGSNKYPINPHRTETNL
ncbi:nuclear pore complex protein DDB_G0274915-like [Anopheles ziemanni]|uniref:nuclear pore complex protein DDB_G0274915-like n=1 Tax=Anopheles coustani TaxID=139045 RepID=UPI0026582284|nr:nuclear pore complex protein DDB_G0274915-like [Anopheles coustani]XP_058178117.1 nuclear pore complex protein DDB_G0274915-like [Anopheles ziemanni]